MAKETPKARKAPTKTTRGKAEKPVEPKAVKGSGKTGREGDTEDGGGTCRKARGKGAVQDRQSERPEGGPRRPAPL